MLDAPESIFDPLDSFGSPKERRRCLIAEGSNRSVEPSKGFFAGSEDFNYPSNDSNQRLKRLSLC